MLRILMTFISGILFLTTLMGELVAASPEGIEPLNATMHEDVYTFSEYYYINSTRGGSLGTIIKNKIRLNTNYHYYDVQGQLGLSGYVRLLSLGSFYKWAGEIDLYDAQGNYFGMIEGDIVTLMPSKFSFYNAFNQLVGTAYMDADALGVTIFDPNQETKILAQLRRVFVKGEKDHWTLSIADPSAIDPRLVYLFTAFALDHQGSFKEDN